MGELAVLVGSPALLAVGEVEDSFILQLDHLTCVFAPDGMAVETEGDFPLNHDGILRGNVTAEVVSARRKFVALMRVRCQRPGFAAYFQRAALLHDLHGKGGHAAFVFVAAAVTGAASAEVMGVPIPRCRPHRDRD